MLLYGAGLQHQCIRAHVLMKIQLRRLSRWPVVSELLLCKGLLLLGVP